MTPRNSLVGLGIEWEYSSEEVTRTLNTWGISSIFLTFNINSVVWFAKEKGIFQGERKHAVFQPHFIAKKISKRKITCHPWSRKSFFFASNVGVALIPNKAQPRL